LGVGAEVARGARDEDGLHDRGADLRGDGVRAGTRADTSGIRARQAPLPVKMRRACASSLSIVALKRAILPAIRWERPSPKID